ncbi:MAG: hypothetical protein AAGA23_02745 [Pseudomonadota bacterium]
MSLKLLRLLAATALMTALVTGCGGDDEAADAGSGGDAMSKAAPAASAGDTSPLLAYIPANTPYFVANRDQMDDKSLELMWEMANPALAYAQNGIDKALADEEMSSEPLARAILEELNGNLNREGLAGLGIEPTGNVAMYGVGILPVFRANVSDGAKLKATIERIEEKSGQQFTRGEYEGMSFYEGGEKDAAAIVAINGDEVILSVVPNNAREAGLKQLFSPAAENVTARMDALNKTYDLLPMLTVAVDSVAMVNAVLTDNSEVAQAMFGQERGELSEACIAEFQSIAAIAPEIVSGYTRFDDSEIDSIGVIKLRDDIAGRVTQLAAPMAGMGQADDVLFQFGMAFDILKTKQFAQDMAAAVAADPYQCDKLADLNQGMTQMQAQLAQPLPPVVGNIKGFRMSLKDMDLSQGMPQQIRALVMVGISNPQLVVGMASAFVPQLATLQLSSDGSPSPLPAGVIPFPLDEPHLAMTDAGIALSIGTGEQEQLKGFLDAPEPSGDAPWMVMGYDQEGMALYQQQMQQAMAAMSDEEIPTLPVSDLFDRQTMNATFTNRGIEVFSRSYLK